MNASSRRATTSLFDLSAERLRRLAHATGLGGRAESIVGLFKQLIDPWGHRPVPDRPEWLSCVGDDHTPLEFSTTFGDKPELRILFEPLGRVPSLVSNRDEALSLLHSLAPEYAINLTRFERIRDLFCPADPIGAFSVWIAVGFSAHRPPDFKIYLDPSAQGRSLAPALVEEAMVRLGFPGAWPLITQNLLRRGPDLDELNYLSLDLSASPDARIKVYARHLSSTPADLESAASVALSHRPGDVTQFLSLVAPKGGQIFDSRAPSTCYAFVGREGDCPVAATTHFPINSYAPEDRTVAQRVTAAFERFGIETGNYARSTAGFANRPLDLGIGLHSYVSFRRYRGDVRFTTYLAVEAYKPGTVERAGSDAGESGVIEAASRIERRVRVADHPFCRRLQRERFDAPRVALVLANVAATDIQAASGSPDCMSERLPSAPVHGDPNWAVADREARTPSGGLAIARGERPLLSQLPDPAPSAPRGASGHESLAPGRRLKMRLTEAFRASDPDEVAGASAEARATATELEGLLSGVTDAHLGSASPTFAKGGGH